MTNEQMAFVKSSAHNTIGNILAKEFRSSSFKFTPNRVSVRYYQEKMLETELICSKCTLRYAIYGVFAFCPDCGEHNSFQILGKNFEVALKMLDMALTAEPDIADILMRHALEDCISAFDGFGRELCRIHAAKSSDSSKAERISFQNLEGVKKHLSNLFKIDISATLVGNEWKAAVQGFEKRHLMSHKMGIVDETYIHKTGDSEAFAGRKVTIDADEVRELVQTLDRLAKGIFDDFASLQ